MAAILGAVAVTTSILWLKAEAETRRAEASKSPGPRAGRTAVVPTAALAYALKSLELVDTDVGRLFAVRALPRGPTATLTPPTPAGAVRAQGRRPPLQPRAPPSYRSMGRCCSGEATERKTTDAALPRGTATVRGGGGPSRTGASDAE